MTLHAQSPLVFSPEESQVVLAMLRSAPFSAMTAWLVPAEMIDWLAAHDGAGLTPDQRHNLVLRLRTLGDEATVALIRTARAWWELDEADRTHDTLRSLGLVA